MKCTLTFLVLLLLVAPGRTDEVDADVIGRWSISAVLEASEVAALSDQQAQRLIGTTLNISRDQLEFAGRVCQRPDFHRSQLEPVRYFREQAHASAANLGLPAPVTVVHVSCTYVYPKTADKLVLHWRGFFFDATRIGGR